MAKAVEDLDPETEAVWTDWWNTKKTSITDAMSVFRIVTDEDVDDDSPEDSVPDVPFIMRPRQAEALDTIERYFWGLKQRAARIICLKSRRYGMTTFFLLLGLERILRVPGYQVLLVAQDDSMARYHFQRLRDTFEQIPTAVLKAHGVVVVKSTDQQIVLRHGESKTSSFTVAPAKRNALGRGAQYHMLILTEYPAWPRAAKQDLSGILRACRNMRGNIICFESTARGYDDFQRRYNRAVKRRSDYRGMFIASYEHPLNRKPFESEEAEAAFIKSIGTEPEYGAEDEIVLFRKLTVDLRWPFSQAAEFLNWRRSTLVDDCEGSIDALHREEPNTAEEAFSGTGIPIFKKEIVEAWRPAAEAREAAAERGNLLFFGGLRREFIKDLRGELVVFSRPEPGRFYGLGSDVASGAAVHSDGKTEADFSYTCVKDARTKITVARVRVHMEPTEFAELSFHLARWYGCDYRCHYIERAINDSGTCINAYEDCEDDDVQGASLLLGQRQLIKTDDANAKANWRWTPGHKTTQKTKPKLITNIHREILQFGMPDGEKECPFDVQFITEAMRFERDERTGRMEAAVGHDDAVIAEGLALEACARVLEEAPPEEAAPEGPEDPYAMLIRHSQAIVAQEREGGDEGQANELPGMPDY